LLYYSQAVQSLQRRSTQYGFRGSQSRRENSCVDLPGHTTHFPANHWIITVSIWMPPYLAETVGSLLEDPLKALFVSDAAAANVNFEVGEQNLISQWIYALVTPFYSTIQGLSKDELLLNWQGGSIGPFAGQPILMDQNTTKCSVPFGVRQQTPE
jgi:hypothetical protein